MAQISSINMKTSSLWYLFYKFGYPFTIIIWLLNVCCCSCSVAQLYATLCNLMDCSTPGLSVPHQLPKFAKFMSIASVMPSAISSSDALFSFCLQPFPGSGILPMSQLFASDDQNTGVSASVLPLTIQGGFPLKLTGLFSLLSKGLTGVFSSTTFRRHQFFSTPPSFWSSSHSPYHVWPLGKPQPWQYGPLFTE